MGLDLAKMRSKLKEVKGEGGGSGGSSKFWRPSDGQQTIRILPAEDGDPFKTYHFHYNVSKGGVMCPSRNFGDECPICDFATTLFRSGDEDSKEAAKKLFVRQRFFSPVLVRGEEDEGVRVWGYGKMAYQTLLELACNPEYGDFTDLHEGTDLNLTYGKQPGAMFPKTTLTPKRNSTAFCADIDEAKCREIMNNVPDFDTLFDRISTVEAKRILDEYLAAPPEESSSEVSQYGNTAGGEIQRAFNESLKN